MRRGVDSNVLVYAHLSGLESHAVVRAFLLAEIRERQHTLVITPLVLHEFVHVITDARRFDPPVSMPEAIAIARSYLGRTNVECVPSDEAAMRLALDLLDRHRLGRKRIADTLLAATLLQNGVTEVLTCNADDFAVYEGLTAIDPRREE